jgi:Protein of unknown function (DUF3108)
MTRDSAREWLAATAWFVALAVILTWPLVLSPASKLAALEGPGDPYLNLWILGWDLQTIVERPSSLFTLRIFDANIFHPARQTLTYSDNFLLQAIALTPIYAITGNPVLCYNLLFFGSLVASALAMFAFIRAVTGSAWGAVVAGTVWGFWPYHFAHLMHLQLQALYLMPLTFLFLHRVIASRRRWDALGLGVAVGLQAIASVYYGVIGGVGLIVSTILISRGVGGRRVGLLIRRLLLAIFISLIVVAPVLVPYLQAQQREGFGRNLFEASRHAASLWSYVTVPHVNALYASTGVMRVDQGVEGSLFPGLVVIALAVLGARVARKQGSRPLALSAYGLIVAGIILSLGPDGIRPLYAFLQKWVFGFQAIRAPGRFSVLVMFGLACLAALGTRELVARAPAGTGTGGRLAMAPIAPLVILALLTVEYANRPFAYAAAPAMSTMTGRWLKQAPQPGAVVYLPVTIDNGNTPFMVESLEHRRPIVNGYSGQRPAFYSALVDTLHEFPSADALWSLHDLDVRFIVTSGPLASPSPALVERANFPGGDDGAPRRLIYELVWSDEIEAALGEPVVPEPPPPGPLPFGPGEQAGYTVTWDGPAGKVEAGTIELKVIDESEGSVAASASLPPAALSLHVRARTASWISRFFEADDEFVAYVSSDLMSVRHARKLREGRRKVDDEYVFDREAHQVRWVGDEGKPPLRLWPGARDPVAAFYYLRTLPLSPGTRLQIPVNDNGRNLSLDVKVEGVERIQAGGRQQDALRVTPVLRQRVARRAAPEITVWLSQDAHRLPLAAEYRAGFGAVRLELRSHTPR